MTTKAQTELERYTRIISEFDFELSTGKLNLSSFMGNLYQCLAIDRQLQPPHLSEMLQALINIIERPDSYVPKGSPGLKSEPVLDWSPEWAAIFPDRKAITIHLGTLLYVHAEWIYSIGQMLPDHATDRGKAYLAWPRAEWHLTNTFLQRFHSQFWSIMRDVDLESAHERGFSNTEALNLTKSQGIDFDSAVEQLVARNMGFNSALDRVDQAIEAGFPLEAITVCESLISSCLHNFLTAVDVARPPEMFHQLIVCFRQTASKAQSYPADLVEEIDAWRRERNNAMHRFVARNPVEMAKGQQEFLEDAKKTAIDGRIACAKLLDWFQYESAFFLETEFNLPGPTLN